MNFVSISAHAQKSTVFDSKSVVCTWRRKYPLNPCTGARVIVGTENYLSEWMSVPMDY